MDTPESFIQQLANANEIVILTHVNPDGDTLGTALGLRAFIEHNFQKQATVVLNSDVPEIYKFLPGTELTVHNTSIDKKHQFELVIAIDIASKDRMGYSLEIFDNAKFTINIDHHVTNNAYGVLNYIEPEESSAGEVLFNLLENSGFEIDQTTATCLYTAICTDTGNFKYDNTTNEALQIAGKLAQMGAKPSYVSSMVYASKPKAMVMLSAYCINNAVFLNNNKIAYTVVTLEDFQKFGAKNEHTEGIVESLREIKDTEIAILFKEIKPDQTKVSMRSKTTDISKISAHFGGGGHKFAAGCTINRPYKIAIGKITELINQQTEC